MNNAASAGMTRLRAAGYGAAGEIRMPNAEWNPKAETRMLSSAFFAPQRWKHARCLG